MELSKHYNSLYSNAVDEIRQNPLSVNPLFYSSENNRRGVFFSVNAIKLVFNG